MPSRSFWFSVAVRNVPEQFTDGIVIAEGFDDDSPPKPDELHYAILARTVAGSETEAQSLVREATIDLEPFASSMIADDVRIVVRQERRVAAAMQPGDVLLKTSFVGFKPDCPEAQASATEIIKDAIQRSWWQFWR